MAAPRLLHTAAEKLSGLSWRVWLVGGYLFIAVALVVSAVAFVFAPFNTEIEQRQFSDMISIAQANATILPSSDDAEAFAEAAAKNTDLRVTVLATDGSVIADSEVDPATMGNHLGREEVIAAIEGEVGTAARTSETDNESRLYVAVPATYLDEPVVLRISETSTAVHMATQNVQTALFILAFAGCVLILIIAAISLQKSRAPFQHFDRLRSDFVANASHELKTPVAAIRLLSEAIRDASEMDDKRSLGMFVDRLENEVERLQRLVIDLLDLSRLEEDANIDDSARVDVHSTLVASVVSHREQAEDKGLSISIDDRAKTSDTCYAAIEPPDASLIFDNLIENAIMYTEEGSICVTFEPRAHEFAISVRDTGIGIPEADQTRIFERFYRVDKAHSREVGGTGLGLALVRHAVERSHGKITLKSTLGEGSEFTVTLPRAKR